MDARRSLLRVSKVRRRSRGSLGNSREAWVLSRSISVPTQLTNGPLSCSCQRQAETESRYSPDVQSCEANWSATTKIPVNCSLPRRDLGNRRHVLTQWKVVGVSLLPRPFPLAHARRWERSAPADLSPNDRLGPAYFPGRHKGCIRRGWTSLEAQYLHCRYCRRTAAENS